ncbi:serine/threonine protein kinase, partial [Noviherbaspirillum sp.]|uniref:serine/threonine protein kinase n=1 Tax=Noviherbaspirillum sp. TaxID=1926288 RepID=UPI002FE3B6D0
MDFDNDRTVARTSRKPSGMHTGMGGNVGMNTLPIGTRLGEFEIINLIGEGGFGIVYLAYDHSLDRNVAIKEYMPSGLASRTRAMHVTVRSRHYEDTFVSGLKSFINEARLLARFDSPSLVKVYRFWEENGTAYMVMPYYVGMTLKQALKERHVEPDEEWVRALLANLFDALETIHREQCYHRDVAPDNILLLNDGRPVLLDFGAARRVIGDLTQGPTVILKPGFAPIEQYADIPGLRQGAWTDIYALAAVVYYLMTGKAPSPAVSRVMHDDLLPARQAGRGRYSDGFLEVIDHALAVRPEHRIQSIDEMRRALNLEGVGPHTLPAARGAADPAVIAAVGAGPGTGARAANRDEGMRTRPNGGRGNPPEADDDWMKTMVADKRTSPPQSKRSKSRLLLPVLVLCAGAGVATIGYHLVNPPAGPTPMASTGPAESTPVAPDSGIPDLVANSPGRAGTSST